MGEYLQQNRKLRVTTPLGENTLLLKSFSGSEGISTLFGYRLQMIAENKTKVPFDAVLGQPMTIHMRLPDESSETHLNGLCVRFAQAERDATFTVYEAEIVPDVWKLTRKAQSRIFQHKTVKEILQTVFEDYTVTLDLNEKYEPRDYCVQYRETDFNFGARLMEEEGIHFYFEHSDGSHKMIASDSALEHPTLPGESKIVYEELEGGVRDDDRIWAWKKEQELRPGKYVLWDHCFELAHNHLAWEDTILASVPVGKETHKLKVTGVDALEIYDAPGEYAQRFDGISSGGGEQPAELQKIFLDMKRTVALRMDEETTPAVVIRAKSNVKHVVSGYKFKLQRHFNGDGDYVITGVQHQASFGADYRSGKAALTYENEFACIPAALPYRPRRTTPKPVVQGSQTAMVVGPSGEEIFTDKYGRVKVQFHWDRQGKNDDASSCWIRVGTSWAGRNWGAIRIPRIGQEVIVDFLEGDPDQPIIVGSVYNAEMMPPWDLPGNKTRSGVKSRSSKGGGPPNFNEIMFEDKKGGELLKIHAERNQSISVEADETHTVGNDRSKSISRDETTSVGRNRMETVAENETIAVGVNRVIMIGATETRTIGAAEVVTIGAAFALTIGAAQSVTVGGNATTNVGGNDSTQVRGSAAIVAGKSLNLQAADSIQLQTGEASISMKKDGTIIIKGKDITVEGSGKINVKASNAVTIKGSKIGLN